MESLPLELLGSIMDYCWISDVVNLACCSRDHHALLKPILWKSVRIPISSLASKLGPCVENLRYTTHLGIKEHSTFLFSNDQEDTNANDGSGKGSTGQHKAADVGVNLTRLISYCNPMKVVCVDTDLSGISSEYILERLHRVKTLKLNIDSDVDGTMINKLIDLEELQIHSKSHHGITDDTFWYSITGDKISKLKVYFQNSSSDTLLLPIGKWSRLEYLSVTDTFMTPDMMLLDLEPLCKLTNIMFLDLHNLVLRDEDLKRLCQCLNGLKTLLLRWCRFTDDALSEIHCLQSLAHLDLSHCKSITSRCLLHLIPLSLYSLTLTTDICPTSVGTVTYINSDISVLNKLSALKKVCVHIPRSGRKSSAVITYSLCHKETWKVNFDTDYRTSPGMVGACTFTR